MNDSVMDLSIVNLAIAYIFVLLLLIIFRARGIRRENMIREVCANEKEICSSVCQRCIAD